ncbi:hypothetical protein FAI41_07985 [Acetobacteraceae bacterium]|nr:hypothetical protein FAI41_07985 [Acetobacteraceae bacterium]
MFKSPVCFLKILWLLPGFFLLACSMQPSHVGLSTDGYGFVKNSPHVSPPTHLTQGQKLELPIADPAPYTPNILFGKS